MLCRLPWLNPIQGTLSCPQTPSLPSPLASAIHSSVLPSLQIVLSTACEPPASCLWASLRLVFLPRCPCPTSSCPPVSQNPLTYQVCYEEPPFPCWPPSQAGVSLAPLSFHSTVFLSTSPTHPPFSIKLCKHLLCLCF